MYKNTKAVDKLPTEFQDIAIKVCRRWREVGLQTPELWTSLHFLNSSYQHVESYLTHVGPTRLIDIELDIQPPESKEAVRQARQILKHIVSHGGAVDRWRSLVVRAERPEALFKVVAFIDSLSTSALQFISLKRRIEDWTDAQWCDRRTILPANRNFPSLTSGPQHPQLSRVELFGLTYKYIHDRRSAMVSNLRHLKFSCSGEFHTTYIINTLLCVSPQLEYLSLDIGAARCAVFQACIPPRTVILPSLRSLSLRVYNRHTWFVSFLEKIDAPAVESLRLSCEGGGLPPLLYFLCFGRLNGALRSASLTANSQCGPIFSSLRHLHLDYIDMPRAFWEHLFKAYSMVTKVTLDRVSLLSFVDSEVVLPNLLHIRYSGDRPDSLIQRLIEKLVRSSPTRVSILRRSTQDETDRECSELGHALHGLVDRVEVYDDNDDFTTEND
ncbi:hypothetical protein BDV93DRAFT_522759 [Ceratobasidium sp. AG-I]|nr:hypothetical protein BDV93DRAFT_522759 [Ceratobasidium sp. AG-I]